MKQRILDWYKENEKTIQAILDAIYDLMPGGKMAKHVFEILFAHIDDLDEQENSQQLKELITETEPALQDIIKAIKTYDENHQNLSLKEVRDIVYNKLGDEINNSLSQLTQSITKTLDNAREK